MSLDLSRHRMEGVSGLSLISPHHRNAINQMMKNCENSSTSPVFNSSPTFGLPRMIPNGFSFPAMGDLSTFGSYGYSSRPIHTGLPSPISPTNRHPENSFESERKGKTRSFSQLLTMTMLLFKKGFESGSATGKTQYL